MAPILGGTEDGVDNHSSQYHRNGLATRSRIERVYQCLCFPDLHVRNELLNLPFTLQQLFVTSIRGDQSPMEHRIRRGKLGPAC